VLHIAILCSTSLFSSVANPTTFAALARSSEEPAEIAEDAPNFGLTGDWGGARASLEEHGVSVELSFVLEANRVLSGGLARRTTAHSLADLAIGVDLERVLGLRDGVLGLDAYAIGGHNASDDVGDTQSYSDLSTGRSVGQISELFYEQWLCKRTCRVKLGKLDANSDFCAPGAGGEGIHSASAFSPTNFALPTYPEPATGVIVGYAPSASWSFNLGVYDGAANTGVTTGSVGPKTFFGSPSDTFYVAELGHRWTCSDEFAGGCTIGATHHTGDFATTSGGTDSGTSTTYVTLDQELCRDGDGRSTLAFLQLGFADEDVAAIDRHVGAGLCRRGCFETREEDAFGLYASWAHFSDGAGEDAESVLELYYKLQLGPHVVLRTDLQFIANPSADSSVDDAWPLSVRLETSF
jgi:porin